MTFNIHAGHNFIVPGAGGYFSETEEVRRVKDGVIAKLRSQGHTVYDCTDENGTTEGGNLAAIVAKCNAHAVDLDVSIHFNAFNGTANGTEVFIYNNGSGADAAAQRIVDRIAELGFLKRGVKISQSLYVLRKTNSPALLVECCFCDNAGDAAKYNADSMANAITAGILGKNVGASTGNASANAGDISIKTDASGLMVTADVLNVRSTPNGPVIGNLKKGNRLGCDKRRWVNGECWFHYADGWVSGKFLTGWIAEGGRWWYLNPGCNYTINNWQKIDDTWYFFGESGWMHTGWLKQGNTWYYLRENGAMAVGAYVLAADGKKYYWLSAGRPEIGDTRPAGEWEEKWTTTKPNLNKWKVVK